MNEDRRARLWALFDQAADLPPQEQHALLDAACRDDAALRAEVERLLADDARLHADGGASAFLDSPVARSPTLAIPAPGAAVTAALPPRIGRYRILRLLGEGGMGVVYEAEQDNPRRPVALKVIRPGLVSPVLLKRFAHEAQILGRLHHPGIAQIYDAGVAEDGQPFFALEFIRGLPLDAYARRHALDPAARLDLLARVCDAVQHAHEQGVIHRDLKPANILVDETGQPKVLDFGVARATDADLLTTTDHTRTGQLLGTLSYMSPEQVAADPAALDQRSDVYTLGVILFELLAGRLPYPLEHLPLPEAARLIREQEPSRLGALETRLRGDVETIVARALEKERARRYASAAELAADVRRHLRNEPIRARPPSALYQLRKFARRNKALVGGVAAVMAALVAGLIGTTLFAVREARQRGQAEHNAALANEEKARADEEKKAALRQAYRAHLAAAVATLQNHDVAGAARHLDDKRTEALRDWEWQHLHSRLDDSFTALPAPPGGSVFLFPGRDGLQLGTVTRMGASLVDLDGREVLKLPPHPYYEPGKIVRVTPRGLWVMHWSVGEPVGSGRVMDEDGKARLTLTLGDGRTASTAWVVSPDQTQFALAGGGAAEGGTIRIYDTASGKERARSAGRHPERIGALAFSPDGTLLASASDDYTARVWDTATGKQTAELKGHTSRVLVVAFRPDGARVATASSDGTVRQWDPRTGQEGAPPYERHTGEVLTAAYSPDGRWIASAGTDRTVRVWRTADRQDAAVLHGHTGTVTDVAFAPDGRRLATLSHGEVVGVSVGYDNTVRVWEANAETGLPVLRGHTSYVYPVAYSPDGQWIASGSWDGTVRLWDALTGEACASLRPGGIVRALAFSPDSTWLVTGGGADGRLQVWDVATAQLRGTIKGPGGPVASVAVRPDGARIAAVAFEGTLTVWEVASGREVFHAGHEKTMRGVAYSPDGRWLASTDGDLKTVCLWDAQTHQLAARFSGHTGPVYALAFSPDGRRLVSGGEDCIVRVWDVGTGECQELPGHTETVYAAAFHPDGTRLATAGRDRTVWLWDLARGEPVVRLPGHAMYVWSLAFSPGGKTLASGSGDQTVRLWDTEPLRVRHRARREADALRPDAERLVERLLEEKKAPSEIVATLRDDAQLSEPLRQAALRAVMRRSMLQDDH